MLLASLACLPAEPQSGCCGKEWDYHVGGGPRTPASTAPLAVSAMYVILRIQIRCYLGKKIGCYLQKGEKAVATSQAWSVHICKDLVCLSQYLSHGSRCESGVNEHTSDPLETCSLVLPGFMIHTHIISLKKILFICS